MIGFLDGYDNPFLVEKSIAIVSEDGAGVKTKPIVTADRVTAAAKLVSKCATKKRTKLEGGGC